MAVRIFVFLVLMGLVPQTRGELLPCNINLSRSLVQIFVYSEGPLVALADNHIISTSELKGDLHFNPDRPAESSFTLAIPVNSFKVNDPELRALAGKDFSSKISNFNRKITRKSMLGKKVLNQKRYPHIAIESVSLKQDGEYFTADLNITLRGEQNVETTSLNIQYVDKQLSISGEFSLSQKRYKIKPYKILFGGIRVRNELGLKFDIVAQC